MHILCPHCHNPTEVVRLTPREEIGRSAVDFLSQLLRGPPSQDCAIPGLNVWPSAVAVALEPRDRKRC